MTWKIETSRSRINALLAQIPVVEVKDLKSDVNLNTLPLTTAYRVDGVHVYVDIVNAQSLVETSASEGERSHKRYLRFMHLYQRIAHLVFHGTDAVKVDFQNERLHLIVYRPFGDEAKRINVAVAVAQVLLEVLAGANELHAELPNAVVAAGIETGETLAVRNGTHGDREPLFIGNAANQAAKLLASGKTGIFLGPVARAAMGSDWYEPAPAKQPLKPTQIAACVSAAAIKPTSAKLLDQWKAEVAATPQAIFDFYRPTPPLADLDMESLGPARTARIDTASVRADIDGFTKFVASAVASRKGETAAIRVLHAVRSELRNVLKDFGGRKVRYVGDCVEGVLAEGARATEAEATVQSAVSCAGAMRDAFDYVKQCESGAGSLGLAIGLEYGPVSVTRLGVRGSRDRCSAGSAVHDAQAVQEACNGTETGLGPTALVKAPPALRKLFDDKGKARGLTANVVGYALVGTAQSAAAAQASRLNDAGPAISLGRAHAKSEFDKE